MSAEKYQIDLTNGPLFRKILLFCIPLLLSNLLQLTFHIADMIVVGKFASATALAGVGCAFAVCAVVINVFQALSVGTSVLAARYFGAKDMHGLRQCVHTSIALALFGGIGLMIAGEILTVPILKYIDTPADVFPEALTYLRIIFLAIPAITLYNFGCAILRATGDTRRPLYFLAISGVINVLLNLFCVLVLKMGAGGVAVATAVAHVISAVLILQTLTRSRENYRLIWRFVKFNVPQCKEILKIGVPASVHSSTYAVSNILIQSALNSIGTMAVAGFLAAGSLESLAGICAATFHHTTLTVIAQNHGAGQLPRIKRGFFYCIGTSMTMLLITGWTLYLFGRPLLYLFTNEPQVVALGLIRMQFLCTCIFICSLQECAFGALRGLGYSFISMAVPLAAVCGFRLLWVLAIFPKNPTFANLMVSFPISWTLCGVSGMIMLHWIWNHRILQKKLIKTA